MDKKQKKAYKILDNLTYKQREEVITQFRKEETSNNIMDAMVEGGCPH